MPDAPELTAPPKLATATPAHRRPSFAMSAKDLITIGIFAAIFMVSVFAMVFLGFFNPLIMVASLGLSILAGAIPFLLFVTRIRHAGMLLLFALILGVIHLATGHPPIGFLLTISLALIGELILWRGRYTSRRAAICTYGVFALWTLGPWLPLFYAREAFFSSARMQRMGPEYRDTLDAVLSAPVLGGAAVACIGTGLVSGFLASKVMSRHFVRAGLA